jgi:hypothetical protein
MKDELSVNEQQNLLLRGDRIVIPQSLQNRCIELAHEGHQGITKTKSLIRSKVWFPNMDNQVEQAVRNCVPCQVNSSHKEFEPLNMSPLPKCPWTQVSIDFCGPLPCGSYLMVFIDEYSRYPIAEVVQKLTANSVIPVADKTFAMFGYPEQVKTDNGPPFQSNQWCQFMKFNGISHRKITPLWPQANAQVERMNQPILKAIRSTVVQHRSWQQELHKFLHAYRTTPHCSTQFTPYRLMFGRDPRTKLPQIDQARTNDDTVRQQDAKAKQIMKKAADKHVTNPEPLRKGDHVLIRQVKRNKLSTPYSPQSLKVTSVKGSMVTAKRPDGSRITRNRQFFKKMSRNTSSSDAELDWDLPDVQVPPNVPPPQPRYPRRINIVAPQRLIEEC